jgi:hypothetical protein
VAASDNRLSVGAIPAYVTVDGKFYALSGDEDALFVKPAASSATIVMNNPAQAPAVPTLQALTGAGQVVEVLAVDLRATPVPSTIYLQVFDSVAAPVSGTTQPSISALPLCTIAAYDWTAGNLVVANGLWVALSSTPLLYTAIAASQEFSITARVLP